MSMCYSNLSLTNSVLLRSPGETTPLYHGVISLITAEMYQLVPVYPTHSLHAIHCCINLIATIMYYSYPVKDILTQLILLCALL